MDMDMEWLKSSIGEHLKGGSLPSVPDELRLEQCFFAPVQHPRAAILAKKYLHQNPWTTRDMAQKIPVINDSISMAAYVWPNSIEDERALTLIKCMQWIFLVDNAVDDLDFSQADKLCHHLCHHIFDSDPSLHTHNHTQTEHLLTLLGLEWWKEIQGSSSVIQQARWAAVFTKYLRYQATLVRTREKLQQERILPRLEEYTHLRRFSSGFLLLLEMIEYDVGIEIDEETYESPILQRLVEAAHDHTAYINDIISFPKEFANGEVFNLLPVLHGHNNEGKGDKAEVPFPVAVSQAWHMVREHEQDVARLAQQLRQSLTLKMTPHLERYVETLCTMLPGNWAWASRSPRYQLKPLTTTKTCIDATFSECRSSPFSRLAFSPFKNPSNGMRILHLVPKLGKKFSLSFQAKSSFSFPSSLSFFDKAHYYVI